MFDKTDYQSIFNQRADSYHKAMLTWPVARDEEFLAIIEDLDFFDGIKIVDIPAGGGYLTNYLPDNVQLHHLETSELFAELCHSGSTNPLDICTLDNLPIEDGSVDAVVSLAGLHHTENKIDLFREIYRSLKSGGKVLLADAEENSFTAKFLDGWMAQHNSMGHNGWFFNKRTKEDLESLGFEVVKAANKNYYWNFSSKKEAAEYCKLMFGIDLAEVDAIEDALDKELGFVMQDGKACLKWQLHFIEAIKP